MNEHLMWQGMRVILNQHLSQAGAPVTVRRSWRDRLLSWPWRPWIATRTHIPQVPSTEVLVMGNTLHMHPALWRTLKDQQERESERYAQKWK